jgi:branched-chain amino acid transport system ATP-binding protein
MSAGGDGHFLECRDLHAYYGESYVIHGVSLTVAENQILTLLGRNGAGKTSTLRTIARADQPALRSGEIHLRGLPLHDLPTYKVARLGVALVPEDRRVIPGLSVEENLVLAQIGKPAGWSLERIYEHFPRLAERRRQEGVTLSGGEQQMLAIARALAGELSLLLLDEPYEGLAPQIVREIEAILVEVKASGLTIIIVEQNAVAALRIADRCTILDDGAVVFTGAADEVLANERIRREYLAL